MVCRAIASAIRNHWADTASAKTPEQEEAERYLLCGRIKFNRLMLLPAAVLVQACCGSIYAWSVYNLPIERHAAFEVGSTANTFYIAIGLFGPSAAVFGPWLERHGPRKILLISSSLFFAGHLLTALSVTQRSLVGLYLSYGVVGGCGLGSSYIVPVSPLQKWFPDCRGLVAGLAVCGFGGGSMIASKVQNALLQAVGVPRTFIILGSTYFVLMLCCALVLRTPPSDFKPPPSRAERAAAKGEGVQRPAPPGCDGGGAGAAPEQLHEPEVKLTLIEALQTREYRIMYCMLGCNAIAGLLTVSKLADICQLQFGRSRDLASTVVAVNSAFNLSGRVLIPALSDLLGRKPLFMLSMTCQAVIVMSTPAMIEGDLFWPWVMCMFLLTAFYGSGFGLIPAFLTDMFGAKNIGALHGIILTAKSFMAVVGGFTFSSIYEGAVARVGDSMGIDMETATKEQILLLKADRSVYTLNYMWIGCVILLGILLTPWVRTGRDRLFPAKPDQIFALRLGRRLLRLQAKLEWMPQQREEQEWQDHLRTLPQNQKVLNEKIACPSPKASYATPDVQV